MSVPKVTIQHATLKTGPSLNKFVREKLCAIVNENSVVLDAGCGGRNVIFDSSKVKELVGVDMDESAIKQNKQVSKGLVGDLENLAFDNAEFDVVISFNVIEHLESPKKFIEGVAKTVKAWYRCFDIDHWYGR